MSEPAQNEVHEWPHFVALSCDEGRRWVKEYRRPECLELTRWIGQALAWLRRGRVDDGCELLVRAEERARALAALSPSLRHVLDRFYYGALAYLHYCLEDFDTAQELLERSDDAVRAAIEERRFLLPLAVHCHEFCLQHARIARSRRRWQEMREHIARSRAMMQDRLPLCVPRDGAAVYVATVAEFYRSIPGLSAEELAALRDLLDDGRRLELFERFVAGLYALRGPVIPYLPKPQGAV